MSHDREFEKLSLHYYCHLCRPCGKNDYSYNALKHSDQTTSATVIDAYLPTPRSPCPHTLPFPIIASPFVFALTIPDGHGGARVQRNSKAQDVLRRHRECFEVKDGQPVYQEKQDLILRQG